MKFAIVFAAVLAVSSAAGFGRPSRPSYNAPQFSAPSYNPAPSPARVSASRPSASDENAQVLRYDTDISPDGAYSFNVETDNGIAVQAQGTPRDFGGNPPLVPVVAQGTFSWTSPEGEPISISYVADENGYQPQGSHLPTPPPVPEAIARALDYIAKYQN